MSDPQNGTPLPRASAVDPLTISTEVYLLDALVKHGETVANQFAFRGKLQLGQRLAQLLAPVWQFRMELEAETRSGIVLVGPGGLPPARG